MTDIYLTSGTSLQLVYTVRTLTDPLQPYDPIINPYVTVDLSTYSASLVARPDYSLPPVIELVSGINIILTNTGLLTINFTPELTSSIPITNNQGIRLFYNFELRDNDGVIVNALNGNIYLSQNFINL
jgi:hypothetical protein